ncbi:hypothetical protein ACJZ2D_007936 [Fusarium nematophilum]
MPYWRFTQTSRLKATIVRLERPVGNSFSSQRSTRMPSQCFRWAINWILSLATPITLLGYESLDAGRYDEANTAYHDTVQVRSLLHNAFGQNRLGAGEARGGSKQL